MRTGMEVCCVRKCVVVLTSGCFLLKFVVRVVLIVCLFLKINACLV